MNANVHPVTPEEIMVFIDGELSADRAGFIAAHLRSCERCEEVAENIRGISREMRQWTVPSRPLTAKESEIISAARRSDVITGKSRPFRSFMRSRPLLMWGAGVTTVAALLITFSSARHSRPTALADLYVNASLEHKNLSGTLLRTEEAKISSNLENAPQPPMIARTVSLSIVTKDFAGARATLDAILIRHHGYMAQLTSSAEQNTARSLEASLRIPAAELVPATTELKSLGRVENEKQSGEEVTQQHADLVARLKNARETEERLQTILERRTGKVSDVLAVEQEIARVRGEIEQMEAQQASLIHRVDFVTVDVTMSEEYKAQMGSAALAISTRFHNAIVKGFHDAWETIVGLILFLSEYGPSMLVWFAFLFPVAWLFWRRWGRSYWQNSPIRAR
jgi:hypothetical protein